MFFAGAATAEIPPIMYINSSVSPELPVWASCAAVQDDISLISRRNEIDYYFSLPVEPSTGCTVFNEAWDAFGSIPGISGAVVKVRIVEASGGFGGGHPGTMFRGEFVSDLKGNLRSPRQDYLFFAATGEFSFEGRKICVRDSRFPNLQVGDEAILLVRIDYPEQNYVSIGDGGVVGIRDGRILEGGDLLRFLGTPKTVSGVVDAIRTRDSRNGKADDE
jgi:hypothetical protein